MLAVEHGQIPPTLHFREANPAPEPRGPVRSLSTGSCANGTAHGGGRELVWDRGHERPCRIEQTPPPAPVDAGREHELSCSPVGPRPRLTHVTDNLARYLHAHPELELADVAHTLQSGRVALAHRRTLIATDRAEAVAALKGRTPSGLAAASSPPVAFLFPGQGAQHLHMAARVYAAEPLFRAELDRAAQLLHSALGLDLRQIVFPAEAETDRAQELLRQTAVAQPALFAVEVRARSSMDAVGRATRRSDRPQRWRVRGGLPVRNLSFEDGLVLVAERGRLVQEMPPAPC